MTTNEDREPGTAELLYALRKMRPFSQPRKGDSVVADVDDAIAVQRGLAEIGLQIVSAR